VVSEEFAVKLVGNAVERVLNVGRPESFFEGDGSSLLIVYARKEFVRSVQLLAGTLVEAQDALLLGSRLGVHFYDRLEFGLLFIVQLLVIGLHNLVMVGSEHLFDVVDHLLLRSRLLGSAGGELPAELPVRRMTHDTKLVLLIGAALLEQSLELLLRSFETAIELNSLRVGLEILAHDSDVNRLDVACRELHVRDLLVGPEVLVLNGVTNHTGAFNAVRERGVV